MVDYLSVTELSGDEVSQEQVERICHRYFWAGQYCRDKDVLEVACGTGQGLGYLAALAKSLRAGDYSEKILEIAKAYYKDRIELQQFDAQEMPYADNSQDVIIMFEAIYYIPSAEKFVSECKRVLRDGGKVLIATANKDLFDFNPSPYTYDYYGSVELNALFSKYGFSTELFGYLPTDTISWKQKIARPIKKLVVSLGLMPKTMTGKKLLKSLVFGKLVPMPPEIDDKMGPYSAPTIISKTEPDTKHKVIYCLASLPK